jgi:beta-lactamase regulating signal transducer with metallopeptidase domain
MRVLNQLENGEMVALGWTLLHFCWQGTVLALLYALIDGVMKRASARVRYGIAMLALLLMPVVAIVTLIEQQRLLVKVPRGEQEIVASQLGTLHHAVVNNFPVAGPIVTRGEFWIAWNADRLLPWVDGLWLLGVLLLALRATGGWVQLEILRRRAKRAIPAEIEASFDRIAERLQVGRKVALRISDEVISPLAMGVWRTVVVLPVSAITQLAPAQLEAVLAHELAHIRRWDYLCNLLQTAIECLLFFHPAVWWMSRRTRDLREICCDRVAARSCDDPVIYAEALLQLEEQRAARLQLAAALHGPGGSLLERVKQVLGEGITMERRTISGMRVAVAGAVVLGLLFGPRLASGLKAATNSLTLRTDAPALKQELTPAAAPATKPTPALPPPAPAPEPAVNANVAATPAVAIATPAPSPNPFPIPSPAPLPTPEAGQSETRQGGGADYIARMRDAGYPLDLAKDLDTLVSLRSVGVTPEYAKSMAQAGMGTPTVHDLISLKAVGVTPEYIAGLKSQGITANSIHEVMAMKSLGITPEYEKSIASLGLGVPSTQDLVSLKAVGVTPEYVAELKSSGIAVRDLHELNSMKAVGVTPEYLKGMASTGFSGLSTQELVSLRAQGVTPEYARWVKQNFPNADKDELQRAAVFHVDADFIAKAKSHGFPGNDLDKLVKLKMTGLLD